MLLLGIILLRFLQAHFGMSSFVLKGTQAARGSGFCMQHVNLRCKTNSKLQEVATAVLAPSCPKEAQALLDEAAN